MLDQSLVNVIKGLIIDGVNKAKSGHPGGAMSSAAFATVLFREFLSFDPKNPSWMGRDRFVLSAGHESMLLYSLLFMNDWLTKEDLQSFRQLHSRTPGHPENYLTPGVECTTGPLGQGAAMSVGFAVAQKHLAAKFGDDLFPGRSYALLGDGCMQEDVTLGAASLAGHWGLNHLIWYYDKNSCQISGPIERATSDDEVKIFEGFGWRVINIDAHNLSDIRKALQNAIDNRESKPTLIVGRSIMGHGCATMEGDHETHGAPLPQNERLKTKKNLGIPEGEDFWMPQEIKAYYQNRFPDLSKRADIWKETLSKKQNQDSQFKKNWSLHFPADDAKNHRVSEQLPPLNWPETLSAATRNIFGDLLKACAESIPQLIGGSADLEPSNMTGAFAKAVGDFQKSSPKGRNLNFGVREFPMSAIANGIALHGGLIPFDATFLTFSDYAKPALRLGAIQKIRVLHEYTHDSFYLGEDGPTHQPVEHLAALRVIPDFYCMRPADATETEMMLRCALDLSFPSAICLTRQKLPQLPRVPNYRDLIAKGGYIVYEDPSPTIVYLATGSEVHLALKVKELTKEPCVVVSLPCWELFLKQDESYRAQVMRWDISRRVSIEAATTFGWEKFIGHRGLAIGLDHYGDSAPMEALEKEYGFTAESIYKKIQSHKFT